MVFLFYSSNLEISSRFIAEIRCHGHIGNIVICRNQRNRTIQIGFNNKCLRSKRRSCSNDGSIPVYIVLSLFFRSKQFDVIGIICNCIALQRSVLLAISIIHIRNFNYLNTILLTALHFNQFKQVYCFFCRDQTVCCIYCIRNDFTCFCSRNINEELSIRFACSCQFKTNQTVDFISSIECCEFVFHCNRR